MKPKDYEHQVDKLYGKDHPAVKESREKIRSFTKADWSKTGKEFGAICQALAQLHGKKLEPENALVQDLIRRHCEWLKNFWTPTRESYIGLGVTYMGPDWKMGFAAFDPQHPRLATFLAQAMKIFAENNLE